MLVVALYLLAGLASFVPAFADAAETPLAAIPAAEVGADNDVTEYAPPSLRNFPARLLGTDIQNRPVVYRVVYGARTALLITLLTSAIALSIGVLLGLLAGYVGGVVDEVVMWLVSTLSAVPWILLVLSLGFVLRGYDLGFLGAWGRDESGQGLPIPQLAVVILAMGLTDWVGICRLIRAEVLKLRSLDYVSAARSLGLSEARIMLRHVLPNTTHLVIITFTLGAVGYVQAEVALTFLGIGISDSPSWGRMIDDAKLELLRGVWWQFAAAVGAIGMLCLALSLLGDTLRDVLDPRTRQR
jgi:ABC-type dipeptide/oligopeptide/nickel transport system permease subunit